MTKVRRSSRGFSLVMTLFIGIILTGAALAIVYRSSNEVQISTAQSGSVSALNAPDDNTGVALKDTKRVVVRTFTLEEDPKTLNIALAPAAKLSIYSLNPNQQNLGLPLVVLISDIPRP